MVSKSLPTSLDTKKVAIVRLFEDILLAGTILRVKVTGRSMAPFLSGGEIVTIKSVPYASMCRGDVIFFKDGRCLPILHRIVCKRIESNGSITFQTKGDALRTYDATVPSKRVLGKVVKIEKIVSKVKVKCINMESKHQQVINYLTAMAGFVKVVIFYAFRRLKKHRLIKLLTLK